MRIRADFAALSRSKPSDYALRFVLGGLVTVAAGLIAQRFGPVVGGLFLAFPAIFPASMTLIDKHERQKKREAGFDDRRRGRKAAALDAAGALLGSAGLAAFAAVLWRMLPNYAAGLAMGIAMLAWVALSILLWWLRKHHALWNRATRRH